MRECKWDDLVAGRSSSIFVGIWPWSLYLAVFLAALNLVLAILESYKIVSDTDTIWQTGLGLIYQLQSLSPGVPHRELSKVG